MNQDVSQALLIVSPLLHSHPGIEVTFWRPTLFVFRSGVYPTLTREQRFSSVFRFTKLCAA